MRKQTKKVRPEPRERRKNGPRISDINRAVDRAEKKVKE